MELLIKTQHECKLSLNRRMLLRELPQGRSPVRQPRAKRRKEAEIKRNVSWRRGSQKPRAERDFLVRHAEGDFAVFVVKAGDEAFGHDGADLLWREIDDSDDETADQGLGAIQRGDLSARFANADLGAEVDVEDEGGLFRLGELPRLDHAAHAELHFQKVIEGDHAANDTGQDLLTV